MPSNSLELKLCRADLEHAEKVLAERTEARNRAELAMERARSIVDQLRDKLAKLAAREEPTQ